MKHSHLLLTLCATSFACGPMTNRTPRSDLKLAVEIPRDAIERGSYISLMERINQIEEASSGAMPIEEFLKIIPITEEDKSKVSARFAGSPMNITCHENRCLGMVEGKFSGILTARSEITVAGITGSTFYINPQVAAQFRVSGEDIEICRLSGIEIKPDSFLSPRVKLNGVIITADPVGPPHMSVDAGPFGRYPNSDCDF